MCFGADGILLTLTYMFRNACLPKTVQHYTKTCLNRSFKSRQNKGVNGKCWLNEGHKYCRMLPFEDSAILLTCIRDNRS